MVGLAKHTMSTGYLSETSISKGIACLRRLRELCEVHEVDVSHGVATSAVRSAINGAHFIERVRRECGFDVDVISGKEEARLIYLGARHNIDWIDRRALIVDIGGGSVEFIIGDAHSASATLSLDLGVRRLSERFLVHDPATRKDLKALKDYILEALAPLEEMVASAPPVDFVVGTSGTLRNLAAVAARRNGLDPDASHGHWTRLGDIKEIGRALAGLRVDERAMYHGVHPKRRNTILAGAQLIKYVLRAVNQDCYLACDYSLRDGLVVDFIEKHCQHLTAADMQPQVRRRSVRKLYARFNTSGAHPEDVAEISLQLFDALGSLHGLGTRDRELLENTALLHDIGAMIDPRERHTHSAYLIRNSDGLHGFGPDEIDQMAWLAELVRFPKKTINSDEFADLEHATRARVLKLAGLLRVADGLDRARTRNVRAVEVKVHDGAVRIDVTLHANTGLESTAMEYKRDLFESELETPLELRVRT
jgi:exopolyphosphatase/guanosine-5'-triphosphate,3'-diphosphate pyrophosphatase